MSHDVNRAIGFETDVHTGMQGSVVDDVAGNLVGESHIGQVAHSDHEGARREHALQESTAADVFEFGRSCLHPRSLLDCSTNALVGPAPADVPRHGVFNFGIGGLRSLGE